MKTFVVLGFPRSATSLIAKGLFNEIYMGEDFLEPNEWNVHGYFENKKFLDLNNKILKAAGGGWRDVPSEAAILEKGAKFSNEIQDLIKSESAGKDHWGWKEPRTTLTIRLYLPYLENPHFIFCLRDPKEAALSLNKFKHVPLEEGLKLAATYNDRALNFLRDFSNEEHLHRKH